MSVAFLLSLAACGSTQAKCRSFNGTTRLDSPVVSYAVSIQPTFDASCAFSSCHGVAHASAKNLVIIKSNAKQALTAMVSVPSVALPSMKLIEPGDPAKSFLMRKLDGDACMFDAVCVNGSCGESMPQKSELIDPATRDAVRRWIHQGAKEN